MSEPQRVGADASKRPRPLRILLALGAGYVVLCTATYVSAGGVLAAGWGGMWCGLAVTAGALIGAVAILAVVAKWLTGTQHVVAAVVAVVAAAAMLVVAVTHFGQAPMLWVPALEIDAAYLIIAAGPVLLWGAFLGTWPLRVIGAAAGVGMAVVATVAFAPEPSPIDELAHTPTPQEAFERYKAGRPDVMSTDLPGARLAELRASSISLVVTADGGVVEIRPVHLSRDDGTDRYPCWFIAEPNANAPEPEWDEPELTVADYSDQCVQDDEGWKRVDGLGYAHQTDEGYVFVESAAESRITGYGTDDVQAAGGTRPANADEVAAVVASLRPLTDDEWQIAYDAATPDEPER